jgi:hypothetical protein
MSINKVSLITDSDTKSKLSLTLFSKLLFATAVFNIDLSTATGYAVKTTYFVGDGLIYNLHSTVM